MASLEAISLFSPSQKSPLSKSHTPSSSLSRLTLFISTPTPNLSLKFPISPLIHVHRKSQLCCSAVEEITVEETAKAVEEPSENPKARKKLFVTNLPWAYSVEDIKTLFGECGTGLPNLSGSPGKKISVSLCFSFSNVVFSGGKQTLCNSNGGDVLRAFASWSPACSTLVRI